MQNTVITSTNLIHSLTEIRQAAADLYRFTEKLSLLKIVHQVTVQIIKTVDVIRKEIKGLPDEQLLDVLDASESVLFLEEVVDADTMSELENYILPFEKNLDDEELTRFLSEVTDKIEAKYNVMLQKIHDFNALIKDELE